jgi:hypothetical protein
MSAPRLFARTPSASQATRRPGRRRWRPAVEILEERCVPATFNVNSVADILAPPAGTVTLRSAIQQANATTDPNGNTINLTVPGVYQITLPPTPMVNEVDNAAGEFAIAGTANNNTNLTIVNTSGGTVIVSGSGLSRVFDIDPAFNFAGTIPAAKLFTVTLQGFTIANGRAFDATGGNADGPFGSGGGIRDVGPVSLTLTNMVVSNNSATADGGGVSMENTVSTPWTLTVNNSTVANNRAGDAGGGLESDGSGKVIVNNSVISGNQCVNQGAGIWLDGITPANTAATMIVAGATVTAGGTGYTTAPTVTLTGGGGTGATATAVIDPTAMQVTAVIITNVGTGYTAAPTIAFTGGGGTGAAATAFLPVQSATLTVTSTLVAANTSIGAAQFGGGIGNAGASAVIIQNSTVSDNNAAGLGGGFGDEGGQGTLTVVNSTFANNSAGVFGGGIQEGGPTTVIADSTITGNSAQAVGGGVFVPPARFGGTATAGATTTPNTLTLNNTIVAENVAGPMNFLGGAGPDVSAAGIGTGGTLVAPTTTGTGDFLGSVDTTAATGTLTGITNGTNGNRVGTLAAPIFPRLGPLQPNGGTQIGIPAQALPTRAPLPNSPVIDTGVNTAIGTINGAVAMTDARGFLRIVTNIVDIGAVEFQPPATTTQLNAAPNPVTVGNPVTFTATVTAQQNGSNPVGGTVTFTVDGTAQAPVTVTNGIATLTLATLTAGPHTINATYNGDANFTPSTALTPVTETVAAPVAPPTTTTVAANNTMVTTAQAVTITITVTVQGGGAAPTGMALLTITNGPNNTPVSMQMVPVMNGVAQVTLPAGSLPTGSNNVTAMFQGSAAAAGSTSNTMGVDVAGVMNITAQVTINQTGNNQGGGGKKGKKKKQKTLQQTFMVTNNTGHAIQGPIYFVVDCLSTGFNLQNQTGTTKGMNPAAGDPFLQFIPTGGQLNAGASAMVTMNFTMGKKAMMKMPMFNNFVFAGPGTL